MGVQGVLEAAGAVALLRRIDVGAHVENPGGLALQDALGQQARPVAVVEVHRAVDARVAGAVERHERNMVALDDGGARRTRPGVILAEEDDAVHPAL